MAKKVLLMILDGWGEGRHDHSNAIYTQGAPFIDKATGKPFLDDGHEITAATLPRSLTDLWEIFNKEIVISSISSYIISPYKSTKTLGRQ